MWQFSYRQHILVDIDTSDALHAITRRGKNYDYDWLSQHEAYEIFTEMHPVITNIYRDAT